MKSLYMLKENEEIKQEIYEKLENQLRNELQQLKIKQKNSFTSFEKFLILMLIITTCLQV